MQSSFFLDLNPVRGSPIEIKSRSQNTLFRWGKCASYVSMFLRHIERLRQCNLPTFYSHVISRSKKIISGSHPDSSQILIHDLCQDRNQVLTVPESKAESEPDKTIRSGFRSGLQKNCQSFSYYSHHSNLPPLLNFGNRTTKRFS